MAMAPPEAQDMVLHRSFLEQLEVMGCWQALIFAYNSFARAPAAAEAQLASAISSLLPPDKPSSAIEALFDFDSLTDVAPLTPAAQELMDVWLTGTVPPLRALAMLHAAAATAARSDKRPVAVVRHYLSAKQAVDALGAEARALASSLIVQKKLAIDAFLAEILPLKLIKARDPKRTLAGAALHGDTEELDALRLVLERLEPQAGMEPCFALSGRTCLEYLNCVLERQGALNAVTRQLIGDEALINRVRQALINRVLQLQHRAVQVRASLAAERPHVDRLMRSEETRFGRWLPATAAQVACRERMDEVLVQLLLDARQLLAQLQGGHAVPMA